MPELTIPLIGEFTHRPSITYVSTDKDQKIKGGYVDVVADKLAGSSAVYLVKRPGAALVEQIVSSKSGRVLYASSSAADDLVVVFSDGTVYHKSVAWVASNSTGNTVPMSGINAYVTDGVINEVNHFFISTVGTNGSFYLPADVALDSSPTFTATANGTTTLSSVSSFTGLYVGQALSGTNIDTGARIASLNSGASTLVMTVAATGSGSNTVTFTPLAKILDADFTYDTRGAFAFMDGFLFIMDANGKLYNSALNNPQSWDANDYITGTKVGSGVGVVRRKNTLVAFYSSYHEVFYNNGNPTNSPLNLDKSRTSDIGASNSQILSYADRVFWVGSTGGEGDYGIYMLSDEGARRISTPQVSRIVSQLSGTSFVLQGGNFGGYDFVFFQSSNATYSFMYCIQTDKWYETGFTDCYLMAGSKRPDQGLYAVAFDDSDLLRFGAATFQDDSVAFSLIYQSDAKFINGGRPFIIDWIDVICDTQASGSTTVAASGDDYASFDTLGTIDLTSQLKRIQPGGRYESSAAFKLTDSGNQAWRGQALKVHWTPCR